MYTFSLFGRFRAAWGDKQLTGLEARKVQELLCYLLTYRHRVHSRELLAELLWEGYSSASGKKNMRQTLWQLQSAFSEYSDAPPIIHVDGDFLSINPDAPFEIDIAQFEAASRAGKDISGYMLNDHLAAQLESACQVYVAEFLEGWYVDWCLYERERFQNQYLLMLDKLIDYYELNQEYETAIHFCNIALREEYVRERSHRQLMRLFYLSGNRTTALRQYNRCKEALWNVLQVEPSRQTQALYAQICADQLSTLPSPQPNPVVPADEWSTQEILNCLIELSTTLQQVQQQVVRRLSPDGSLALDSHNE